MVVEATSVTILTTQLKVLTTVTQFVLGWVQQRLAFKLTEQDLYFNTIHTITFKLLGFYTYKIKVPVQLGDY
jgi:hypothetical protein